VGILQHLKDWFINSLRSIVEKRYSAQWLRCLDGNPFCVALAKQKDWEAGSEQKLTIGICTQPQRS
jgi:hypothetical protein